MNRDIPSAPGYTITKDGKVWQGARQVFPESHKNRFGLNLLVVWINGARHDVWRLLAELWYDRHVPLTRDGGLMDWREENVFTLKRITDPAWQNTDLIDEIQLVWHRYQYEKTPCFQMIEKIGLTGFADEQYVSLVKDILVSSVR